ncbi:ephrin-A3b isoform X1 [Sebastes umbrosus]|uniref:ephrin-A3b isoform X1 n=1 Tax=Sebastes umbrosus TaxID=72105 RepID=UPI0018A07E57|nr:ephrin-A3b isoform X1 [Sebastes umbrosus]
MLLLLLLCCWPGAAAALFPRRRRRRVHAQRRNHRPPAAWTQYTGLTHSSGGLSCSSSRHLLGCLSRVVWCWWWWGEGDRESGRRHQKRTEAERRGGAESMALVVLSLWVLTSLTWADVVQVAANRHSVYWNSSNIHLRREGYTMQVNVNDYLDIYCPHYNDSQRMVGTGEQYILYMVSYRGYRNCDPQLGFKRWECNRPHAPHAPIKFSEKFQRYSAFSLGYEFHVGQEYYYISTPTHHHGRSCLRLRVYVCCSTASDVDDEPEPTEPDYTLRPGLKIDDIDDYNPFVPKLEKSVSGSSPSRDRLLLTVTMLFLAALFIS